MNKFIVFLFSFSLLFAAGAYSQEHSEIDSSVPELSAYHKVIYPMWHKAYPKKDYELFKKLLPDINKGAEKIYSAELPGILRDHKDEWDKGVDQLKSSVLAYNSAVESNNEEGILTSAEKLHSDYEKLVRIVRPVTKEVDEYHKVLYMIYHHYWPEKNKAEFTSAADSLLIRADALRKSSLPKWAESKKEDFQRLTEELYVSTRQLNDIKNTEDEAVAAAINKVHTDYQKVEALFD